MSNCDMSWLHSSLYPPHKFYSDCQQICLHVVRVHPPSPVAESLPIHRHFQGMRTDRQQYFTGTHANTSKLQPSRARVNTHTHATHSTLQQLGPDHCCIITTQGALRAHVNHFCSAFIIEVSSFSANMHTWASNRDSAPRGPHGAAWQAVMFHVNMEKRQKTVRPKIKRSGRRGLNPRPRAHKTRALTTELQPASSIW
jgi:hypothetical protein